MLQVGVRARLSVEINMNTSLHGPRMCGCAERLGRKLRNVQHSKFDSKLGAHVAQFSLCGSAREHEVG